MNSQILIWSVVNKRTGDSEFHGTRSDCFEWIEEQGFRIGREVFITEGMVP